MKGRMDLRTQERMWSLVLMREGTSPGVALVAVACMDLELQSHLQKLNLYARRCRKGEAIGVTRKSQLEWFVNFKLQNGSCWKRQPQTRMNGGRKGPKWLSVPENFNLSYSCFQSVPPPFNFGPSSSRRQDLTSPNIIISCFECLFVAFMLMHCRLTYSTVKSLPWTWSKSI